MKRDDTIFFFTLIDLLLQLLFFGVFLWVVQATAAKKVTTAAAQKADQQAKQLKDVEEATGLPLVELTDFFTRMVPASFAAVYHSPNGPEKLKGAILSVRKENESGGTGQKSCLALVNGKVQPLASLTYFDDHIEFDGPTEPLKSVLGELSVNFEDIKTLTFEEFRRVFLPLRSRHQDCVYTILYHEQTKYVYARDAVWPIFYMTPIR